MINSAVVDIVMSLCCKAIISTNLNFKLWGKGDFTPPLTRIFLGLCIYDFEVLIMSEENLLT